MADARAEDDIVRMVDTAPEILAVFAAFCDCLVLLLRDDFLARRTGSKKE